MPITVACSVLWTESSEARSNLWPGGWGASTMSLSTKRNPGARGDEWLYASQARRNWPGLCRHRDRATNPIACPGDDGNLASNTQFHAISSFIVPASFQETRDSLPVVELAFLDGSRPLFDSPQRPDHVEDQSRGSPSHPSNTYIVNAALAGTPVAAWAGECEKRDTEISAGSIAEAKSTLR